MKEIHKYHFVVKLYNRSIITPVRNSENQAWRDVYEATRNHNARYTAMTLVHDVQYIKKEGDQ